MILTLNEIEGLKVVFDRIPVGSVDEILAVDGGSTDGTQEFLESKGIRVVRQQRRGRGDAFRLAFLEAKGDALIFFSPDGNEDPQDLPKFRPLLEAGADLVIGTRMIKGARNEEDDQLLKLRKWANQAFTLMANLTWNRHTSYVTDTINGYRAIRRTAWENLRPDGPGYTIEYQTSIRALKQKLKIVEFPTKEGNRIDGREGSPSIPTGLAFLKLYWGEFAQGQHPRPSNSKGSLR